MLNKPVTFPPLSRRRWLLQSASGLALLAHPFASLASTSSRPRRSFQVCLAPPIVEHDTELLSTVRAAGIDTVWLADFFYGHRPYPRDLIERARRRVIAAGMDAQLITVPLGHPGDSLGARDGAFPLTPPTHWQLGQRPDGRTYAGTSLHPPATEENAHALRDWKRSGFKTCFLDDDFRLARGPGEIGGCFCPAHREKFLRQSGLPPARWDELLDDVRQRRLTRLLRLWLEFTGAELTASFRAQARAFDGDLGIMVMYLGAEKAGIRLSDYRRAPFRVGELMFDDASFGTPKGKTDELFSALFHRRFAAADRAWSETTAYPADKLSAAHLAAKLCVSTLADVRHTMFMSGLTPFPREHWSTLGPACRLHARLHESIGGHRPRGPFAHWWGEAQRCVGDDRPFSLWLALGIPFEVVSQPRRTGWTFLSDFDAADLTSSRPDTKSRRVCRPSARARPADAQVIEESLPALFDFKHRIAAELGNVPHVVDDVPVVCAWYPEVRRVLLWNLTNKPHTLTLKQGAHHRQIPVDALGMTTVTVGQGD